MKIFESSAVPAALVRVYMVLKTVVGFKILADGEDEDEAPSPTLVMAIELLPDVNLQLLLNVTYSPLALLVEAPVIAPTLISL